MTLVRDIAANPARPRTEQAAKPLRARLGLVPTATAALLGVPVAVGLVGTWAPAFGVLPALGGTAPSLEPWHRLFAEPGLATALRLTLTTGIAATLVSLVLALAIAAALNGRALAGIRRGLAPLLAMPHAALALGLAFLLAPSGWIVRALSPWATGWERPPDLALVQDPWGLGLVVGLVLKETPFLLLMTLAALDRVPAGATAAVAGSLGYGRVSGWLKAVLPQIWPLLRLPVYAVLAFSLSVVDMAMILGPTTPPPLAVLVLRWFADPDLARRFMAAAGASLQLLIVAGAIAAWRGGEAAVVRLARGWIVAGARGTALDAPARRLALGAAGVGALLAGAAMLAILLWSVAGRWRFPDILPTAWSLDGWAGAAPRLLPALGVSLGAALASTLIAVVLVVGCLEHEDRSGVRPRHRVLWLVYLPLLVPQIAFLFGIQVLLAAACLDGCWPALVLVHLLFVLPYVFLTLAEPWRALDGRYARSAACLGAAPGRVLWRVKLPMLARPIAVAAAIGFAVSVAQYLPTVFAGAGRLASITTDAVGAAAGGDRRVIGLYAVLQAALPFAAFALVLAIPRRGAR